MRLGITSSAALLLFTVSALADACFFQPRRLSNSDQTPLIGTCRLRVAQVASED